MYFRILLYIFLTYLLYRLVFHFILPIYKTTRQVKKQFREMYNPMYEQPRRQAGFTKESKETTENPSKTSSSTNQTEDYIDFEEVK